MGFLSSVVNYKNLELLAPEKAPKPQHQPKDRYSINKAATINPEINLLGNTVDEAIARLEKYLDDAMIAGLTSVRVVHGKGTGAKGAPKFYNITIAQEKEMIMIVAAASQKAAIMQSILKKAGPDSKAGTIVFSLPTTHVAGFALLDNQDES